MKIRLRNTGAIRNCSDDVGNTMVAAGLADALTPQEANDLNIRKGVPYHELNWSARDGEIVGVGRDAHQYAPALCFRCATCAFITYAHPMDKPAANTTFHFEKHQCPDEVYETYLRLFDAWKSKGKSYHLKGSYDRALANAAQRTKDGLDDRKANPAHDGQVATI